MEPNFKKILISQALRKILRYSLLWPSEESQLNPGIRYKLTIAAFFILTSLVNLPLTIHFFLMIIKYPEVNITEEAAAVIAIFGSYYMICAFLNKQHQVALLLQDLSNFEKFGKPPGFEEENRRLDFGIKCLFSYTALATVIYSLIKVTQKAQCKQENEEIGADGNYCGLIGKFWIPFKTDYFPVFQLCYLYAVVAVHLVLKMCLHISFSAFEIVHHIILRIKHLRMMLFDCFERKDIEESRGRLKKCIRYHIEILDFARRLDESFFNSMFGHLALTGAICACLEKQIVHGVNVVAGTLHFIGWILALFVGCIAGQHLLDSNDILPEALWLSKWYEADLKLKKDVLFMLMRSQKDVHLRAGPFGILSYPLFVSVLKMSYSILCMLTS